MIAHKQMELKDIFEECQQIFEEDKPRFLQMLEDSRLMKEKDS